MVQSVVVALIVTLAFAYSAWALMPAVWQRALRGWLGRAATIDAGDAGGCGGCGGCSGTGAAARKPVSAAAPGQPAPALPVITLHRRLPVSGRPAGKP